MRSRPRFHRALKAKRTSAGPKVFCAIAIVAGLTMGWINSAQGQQTSAGAPGSQLPPLMERQREIALALSACPPAIAEKQLSMFSKSPGT